MSTFESHLIKSAVAGKHRHYITVPILVDLILVIQTCVSTKALN